MTKTASGGARRARARTPRAHAPTETNGATLIGVLSDTHGYLNPAVASLFKGVDHIIHAGDVVDARTLQQLGRVAPLTAVSGNMDRGDLAKSLPKEATGTVGDVGFVVAHKRKRLLKRLAAGKVDPQFRDARLQLVVFGHEHVPAAEWIDGVLHLNPGTASALEEEDDGPTVALVRVEPTGLSVKFIPLERRAPPAD
jgi:putative phosphoesterase